MDWILDKLPVLVFVIVAIVQVVRAVLKPREAGAGPDESQDESEEQQRVREIQERIRRIASQRETPRTASLGDASEAGDAPPVLRPDSAPPEESFVEVVRRRMEMAEQKVSAPVHVESRTSELERQEQLAEKMRQLEETRELARRRAAHVVADAEADAQSEAGLLRSARGRLEDEIRDPQSLRRAFLLREVLGPPRALR
jgi:hypothetical protein